jgi:hypothetical protein
MGLTSRAADFIRSTFSRSQQDIVDAAGGADVGDYPSDIFGNVAVAQSMQHGAVADYLTLNNALMARFVDYERMDEYPDCHAALNIYADDATVTDITRDHVMWAVCKDVQVRDSLNDMLWKHVEVDSQAWESIRIICKYGNNFEEIMVKEGAGVIGLNFLPTPTIRRIEGEKGLTKGFVQSFRGGFSVSPQAYGKLEFNNGVGREPNSGVVLFEPWRVVHMRLRDQRRRAMYGVGVLESARWVFKRLILLEDAALISRLSRAPSRFAFYVDVGKLPTERAEKYLDQIRQKFKKRKFINPKTGKMDLRYSPLSTDEDFFLPVRDSREVIRADVLNTPQWTGVEDIEYFRNKLHSALMVPRAYLGYDENMPSRATLSQEDVRFARSVMRIQRAYREGIRKVARVHLAAKGMDPAYIDFKLQMTVPSSIFELAQLEVQNTRAALAVSMGEFVSKHWILSRLFNFSDEEIEVVTQQKKVDMEAQMAAMGGGGGGGRRLESVDVPVLPTSMSEVRRRPLMEGRSKLYPHEQRLLAGGNKDSERRLEGQLDRVLASNRTLSNQIQNTQSFMSELQKSLAPRQG